MLNEIGPPDQVNIIDGSNANAAEQPALLDYRYQGPIGSPAANKPSKSCG